jgi:glutamate dehydrogenase (NADP+)
MSDSAGYIYDADGIDADKCFVMEQNEKRGRISEYVEKYPTLNILMEHVLVKCDIALPLN